MSVKSRELNAKPLLFYFDFVNKWLWGECCCNLQIGVKECTIDKQKTGTGLWPAAK